MTTTRSRFSHERAGKNLSAMLMAAARNPSDPGALRSRRLRHGALRDLRGTMVATAVTVALIVAAMGLPELLR
jgi:hypothetical protein